MGGACCSSQPTHATLSRMKSTLTFRFDDREEVYEAGDAFYTPAGHIPVQHQPGTEIVMFSPEHELRETEAVMMKNMQSMQTA